MLVFFSDILIYSVNYSEHLTYLCIILQLLSDNSFHAKMSKCLFAVHSVDYLGMSLQLKVCSQTLISCHYLCVTTIQKLSRPFEASWASQYFTVNLFDTMLLSLLP